MKKYYRISNRDNHSMDTFHTYHYYIICFHIKFIKENNNMNILYY